MQSAFDPSSSSPLCFSRKDLRRLSNEQIRLMKPRLDVLTAFDQFLIADFAFLEEDTGRSRCDGCGQSRKYFCYSCCTVLSRFKNRIPNIKLPCRVDIIKHPREIAGKSTAVHAVILCPEHVSLYTHPNMPDYRSLKERVILIFPGTRSCKLQDYFAREIHTNSDISGSVDSSGTALPFDRAVFIDCTWNQVKRIVLDERIAGLPRVELDQHDTLFWRYQTGKPTTYLATVEALYYFVLAVHKLLHHSTRSEHKIINSLSVIDELRQSPAQAQDSTNVKCSPVFVSSPLALPHDKCHNDSSFGVESNSPQIKEEISSQNVICGKYVTNECDRMKDSACVNYKALPDEPDNCTVGGDRSCMEVVKHVHSNLFVDKCCHQYDDLLYFFKFMFYKIHGLYGVENLRAYK